jgi:GntR family transcriptional regulator
MFQIDLKSRQAIYAQITENFKRLIITGALRENERAPSVRDLAKALAVNPNTIQKAYRELESQGYFYAVPGQGSFVAAPPDASRKEIAGLYAQLEAVARELAYLGEPRGKILAAVAGPAAPEGSLQ